MKNAKKGLLCLTVLLFMMMAIVGCSTDSNDSAQKTAEAAAQTSTQEATYTEETSPEEDQFAEEVSLSWIGWWVHPSQDGAVVQVMEEKFNVDFDLWDYTDYEALNVRLAAGEIPDVFPMMKGYYKKMVKDGIVAELPWATIEKYAPKLYAGLVEILDTAGFALTEVDGINYGMPVIDGETGGTRSLIVYRGDWIENVGSKVPETLDEFVDLMKKFTNDDPDGNGENDTYGLSDSMMYSVYGAYGYMPNQWSVKDGALVYGGIQPEMKEAIAVLADLYESGALSPEYVTGEYQVTDGSVLSIPFCNGQIGVSSSDYLYWKPEQEGGRTGANIVELKTTNPDALYSLVYGNPPVGPYGDSGISMHSLFNGGLVVFGSQMEGDEAKVSRALAIFDYACATYEGFMLTRYGIEGTHYNLDGNGYPLGIDDYSTWNIIGGEGGAATFNLALWFPRWQEQVSSEVAWAATMPELRKNGYVDALYFPVESADLYLTELDKIREEAYTAIITGQKPLDFFDTFVAEWKESGGDIMSEDANS